jgi:hypothetical protein
MLNRLMTAVLIATMTFGLVSAAHAEAGCDSKDLPRKVLGFCQTPLFKSYVGCIERTIPVWDPNGPKLRNERDLQPQTAVLAVLIECEPIARDFGGRYGNDLANILQSVANRRVSRQYGTPPLTEPTGDSSTFLMYGEHVDSAHARRGDVADLRGGGFRRVAQLQSGAEPSPDEDSVTDLLSAPANSATKRLCMLQLEGINVPCDLVWYITFKDGGSAIQFNKGTGQNPVVSFFGNEQNDNIIAVDTVVFKNGVQSDELRATGQCALGKDAMGCQARMDDGRLVIGTIFLESRSEH